MIYRLGPRARRVYLALRDRIARGEIEPGSRLPSHRELAVEFGVAPLTVRQVLSQLEEEGLVSRQVGRGTFVRESSSPAILVLEETPQLEAFLADYLRRAGFRTVTVRHPADAMTILMDDPTIILVLADLHVPTPARGTEIVKAIRSRWPRLPLAIIATTLDDLAGLFTSAEWPLHVLPKPINLGQLDDLLRLVTRRPTMVD
jgi:DNA-binding transcriptional regulator YhcF (GntR family)